MANEPKQGGQVTTPPAPETNTPIPAPTIKDALGITEPATPPPAPTADKIEDTGIAANVTTPPVVNQTPPEKPPETPPAVTPPVTEGTPETPVIQPPEFTPEQRTWLEGYIGQQTEQIKTQVSTDTESKVRAEIRAQETAAQEFMKDPYGFMSKHAPALLIEKFDPKKYVKDKLKEKYGESAGSFDPTRQYDPDDPSFDMASDMEEWRAEARDIQKNANGTIQNNEKQIQANLEQTVTAIKTKYGMDDIAFRQKIWDKIGSMSDSTKLELIADKLMLEDASITTQRNLQDQTQLTRTPPSPTNLGGVASPAGKQQTSKQVFDELFGAKQPRVSVSNVVN